MTSTVWLMAVPLAKTSQIRILGFQLKALGFQAKYPFASFYYLFTTRGLLSSCDTALDLRDSNRRKTTDVTQNQCSHLAILERRPRPRPHQPKTDQSDKEVKKRFSLSSSGKLACKKRGKIIRFLGTEQMQHATQLLILFVRQKSLAKRLAKLERKVLIVFVILVRWSLHIFLSFDATRCSILTTLGMKIVKNHLKFVNSN